MESYIVEEKDYKGYKIKVYQDDNAESPREWDNLGKMVCFHNRYNLGDKTDLTSQDFNGWQELSDYLIKEKNACLIFPLYLYDHSGISIKIGSFIGQAQHAEWDSGQVGFVYATKDDILKSYEVKKLTKAIKEKAEKVLRSEVKIYNQYLTGEVYGFRIEDKEDNEIDSCWGYYDIDDITKDAEAIVDCNIEKIQEAEKELNCCLV